MRLVPIVVAAVICLCAVPSGLSPVVLAQQRARSSCADLAKLPLPETTVTVAEEIANGQFTAGRGPATTDLPAFCRVALTVAPAIHIEIWLPRDGWNGRYRAEGGGGYAGQISNLSAGLRAGYATASTDTGHPASAGGSFALNSDGSLNTPLIRDFAERSLRELAVKAKTVIRAYYGVAPAYSYWNGCSTGGRQGLMAVQRFPEEYDGLVIGAPAINWDRFIPSELWPQIVLRETGGGSMSAAKLNAITSAAIAACDALDGVSDGIIDDPRACTYDPSTLLCKAGESSDTCLTEPEANAIRKIWTGPTDARGGRLWFGLEPGAPLTGLAGNNPFAIAQTHFQYWIHQDPQFDWHKVREADFESEFRTSQQKFHDLIGTDEANLQGFRAHGGKMIIWHGEADQLIFPRGTINYFNRVVEANGGPAETAKFARLYLAPGVGHCGGGAGPAPTGVFEAVVNWVEKNAAPTTILASRTVNGVAETRPLCPYPQAAKWTGSGSVNDASNFTCANTARRPADFSVAAPVR